MVRATTRSEAVAIANAFSIPSADSRIGISQIGRGDVAAFADGIDGARDFGDLLR